MVRRVLSIVLAIPFVVLSSAAYADAVAVPKDEKAEATTEYSLVVWDEATKTEHLIRETKFTSTSPEFAYLVPTPTKPEIAPGDEATFRALWEITRSRVDYVVEDHFPEITLRRLIPQISSYDTRAYTPPSKASRPVETGRKAPAQVPAFVMKAEEPEAVRHWLEANSCEVRPELIEWLKWYGEHKWYVTGIKVGEHTPGDAKKTGTGAEPSSITSTVRLSFRTDRPFFPYREPAFQQPSQPSSDRSRRLQLYVMSDSRVGMVSGEGGTPWPGKVMWANRIKYQDTDKVIAKGKLPDGLAGKEWYLTEFEDESEQRTGTEDLSVKPSVDQGAIERPAYRVNKKREWPPAWVVYSAIFSIPVVVVVIVFGLRRRSFKRKRVQAAHTNTDQDELL